ncbi:MAG TPA: hypothetical protein VMT29_19640 [Steroidobacteraceae bacterium]|nr:hypothetical protein [Steroidobacteraceae bacterium]
MTNPAPVAGQELLRDARDFSLVLGGPLFQLLRRAHLADGALHLLRRRIIAVVLLTWAPLLVLSALSGHLLGRAVAIPFLLDLETHIRFLVVVPLLLVAELVVHERLLPIARGLIEGQLIPADEQARFDRALRSAFRWRNSVAAEVLIIAAVYLIGVLVVWRRYTALHADTWYVSTQGDHSQLSPGGMWFVWVSLPVFQFLLLRWYFRLFIWIRFLWQLSRLRLNLLPTHPDNVGGLGELGNTVYAFTVLLVAQGAIVAAQIASRVLLLGAALPQFAAEIAAVVGVLLLVVLGPMCLFAPQLSRAKRAGLLEYGALAERYVRQFDRKWLRGGAPRDEALLGSADIQSLADLANSFNVVRSMRVMPVSKEAVIQLVVAVCVPISPLVLTLMPLGELLRKLLGLIL